MLREVQTNLYARIWSFPLKQFKKITKNMRIGTSGNRKQMLKDTEICGRSGLMQYQSNKLDGSKEIDISRNVPSGVVSCQSLSRLLL
jgi:hypothetical protein